jgi:O-Antigen ligase
VAIFSLKNIRAGLPFWFMTFYLVLIALTGGGARSDIQSLVILRPVSALVLGYALWGMTWDQVRPFRALVFFAIAVLLLVAAHLIPLPPAIWMGFPGRELAAEIDRVAGLGEVWRPVSLAPSQTWNALYSLIVPFAALALMMRLTREQRFMLVPVLILIGFFSGFMGLLQAIGPLDSPLYFYNITNNGSAVGVFANRNHQAVLLACLFPLLAFYASVGVQTIEQFRFRSLLAIGGGLFLIPLLLVTGSRSGLIFGLLGLIAAFVLFRRPRFSSPAKRKVQRFNPNYIIGGVAAFGIAALTMIMSRAEAVDRLFVGDGVEELRFVVWPLILEMTGKYFPVGSGIGTFVEAYQVDEPLRLLDQTYLNHAHNDWLEILMTGGAPAALLAAIAILGWIRLAYGLAASGHEARRDIVLARLGASIIFLLVLASLGDYPLRVPALSAFFVIASVWMASGQLESPAVRGGSKNNGGTD